MSTTIVRRPVCAHFLVGACSLVLVVLSLAGCSSSEGPPADLGVVVDQAFPDLARPDSGPAPDVSPWLGCNNSGGERLEDGCFFEWRCPNGSDRRVTCTAGASGFDCVCTGAAGAEEGRFSDAESCTRSAQAIAALANAACGWQLAEGV